MAKHTITAGCGHTTIQQLYGPHAERQRRIDWMQSPAGKCNPCYAEAKRNDERADRNKEQIAEAVHIEAQIAAFLAQSPGPEAIAAIQQAVANADEQTRKTVRYEASLMLLAKIDAGH